MCELCIEVKIKQNIICLRSVPSSRMRGDCPHIPITQANGMALRHMGNSISSTAFYKIPIYSRVLSCVDLTSSVYMMLFGS
jgi:hypothetical protein